MELLSVLSKETANSFDTLKAMEFHLVLGMFNALKAITDKQNEEHKKAEASYSAPSIPSMPSMSSIKSQMGI